MFLRISDSMAPNESPDGPTEDVEAVGSGTETEKVTDGENLNSTVAQPLQGLKLYAVTVGVCFGAVMVSIDVSVIAMVILISIKAMRKLTELSRLGHPIYHVRLGRYVPDSLVPSRVHLHSMRTHSDSGQDGCRISPESGLPVLL